MGLDLTISARVRHRETGRAITLADDKLCFGDEGDPEYELFDICYWRKCYDLCCDLIDICAEETGEPYTSGTYESVLPQEALRKVYRYLLGECDLAPDEEPDAMWDNDEYELINLRNALALREVMIALQDKKPPDILKEYVPDPADYEAYCKDPDAFVWEFRVINSF